MGYMNLNYCLSVCFYIDSLSHSFELLLCSVSTCVQRGHSVVINLNQTGFYVRWLRLLWGCCYTRYKTKAENEEMSRIQGIMSYLLED